MITCPNCGRSIADTDEICPNCHFNLQKYRDTFFTDEHQKANYEDEQTAKNLVNRQAYRQEFYPKKQNLVVAKMLRWIRENSMIVFLLGIALLIIMSFSRSIGWICFFALLIWLYAVCARVEKIERYTVDERLTEKINQLGSNMFNNVEDSKQKVRSKSRAATKGREHMSEKTETVKKHFNFVQLMVVLMSVINLIVLFTGSGASVSDISYSGKMSITRVLFSLAGRLLSSSSTILSGVILCLIWLLMLFFPILILYYTLKDLQKGRIIAFVLSLVESIFLVYLIFRLSNSTLSNTGVLKGITSQLLLYAVSVGTSTIFLVLSSIMTTLLSGYNLFRKNKQ